MFNWRRRNEGFEWREYVRTTILVRRRERRERLKDAGAAAANHVRNAGAKGAKAGKKGLKQAAGAAHSANSWLRTTGLEKLIHAFNWTADAAKRTTLWGVSGLGLITASLHPVLKPLLSPLSRPSISFALAAIAGLTLAGGAYRAWLFGLDADAAVAIMIGGFAAVLLLGVYLTGPHENSRSDRTGFARATETLRHIPFMRHLRPGTALTAIATTVTLVFVGFGLSSGNNPTSPAAGPRTSTALTTQTIPATPTPKTMKGQAKVLSGDTLRIGRTKIQLADIDAPEASQRCTRQNGRTWKCGRAARQALTRLVRRKTVTCEATNTSANPIHAHCVVNGQDIAATLVRQGNVFSKDGIISAIYNKEQLQAKNSKKGIWSGKAERPTDFRQRLWNTAKKSAPNGCPIKGRVTRGRQRIYLLPWSASYERYRLRKRKGERWFCSEEEAKSAGFKAAS